MGYILPRMSDAPQLACRLARLLLLLVALAACGCSKKTARDCNASASARASIEGCAACCKKRGQTFRSYVDPKSAVFTGNARAGKDALVICSCSPAASK